MLFTNNTLNLEGNQLNVLSFSAAQDLEKTVIVNLLSGQKTKQEAWGAFIQNYFTSKFRDILTIPMS